MHRLTLDIPRTHPAYAGHFPGKPLLPGAVLLDEILSSIAAAEGVSVERCKIGAAKFKRFVLPGDALELEFAADASAGYRFRVRSGGDIVAEGTMDLR